MFLHYYDWLLLNTLETFYRYINKWELGASLKWHAETSLSPARGLSELYCRHAVGAGPAEVPQSLLVKVQGYVCMWLCCQSQLYFEGNVNSVLRTPLVRLIEGRGRPGVPVVLCPPGSRWPVERLPSGSVKISKPVTSARTETASCEASLICPCCPLWSSRGQEHCRDLASMHSD